MKSTVKKLPKSEVKIEIEISSEELDKFIDRVVLDFSRNVKMPGFRPGKVPKDIVGKEIGEERILANAAELAISDVYPKAVIENKIDVISHPQVHVHKLARGNPFIFCAKAVVMPEIKMPDYKKIAGRVERKEISVSDKEVEETLKWLQKSRAKFIAKPGAAELGDFVEVEYWSPEIEGVVNPKGVKDAFILGEGKFLPGFEEKLVGMKSGEEKADISLEIPKNYFAKNLAGKQISIKAKVGSVQKVELPEINDDFAKSLGDISGLSQLKENIKEGMTFEKREAEAQRVRNEIIDKISDETKMEVPDSLVDLEKARMLENYKKNVQDQLQIPFAEYLEKTKKTEKEIIDSFSAQAQRRIKNSLVLKEIGQKEGISISEKEIEEKANETLNRYPSVEAAQKKIDLNKLKDYTKEAIYYEKTFQLLEKLA